MIVLADRLQAQHRVRFKAIVQHRLQHDSARKMLSARMNVNGRPNSDVIRPVANAIDLVRVLRDVWTIDFGASMAVEDAAKYEMPFEFVKVTVYPERRKR